MYIEIRDALADRVLQLLYIQINSVSRRNSGTPKCFAFCVAEKPGLHVKSQLAFWMLALHGHLQSPGHCI